MTARPRIRPKLRLLSDAGGESVSFGAWLRRQREARDISLREIADSSKISLRYLEAFEQDRFDVLPARVFAQGFLREYAKYVGLDPDEVVNHYLASQQSGEPDEDEAEEGAEPKRPASTSNWWFHLLLVIGVAATLVLAALLAFKTERGRTRDAGSATDSGSAATASRPALPPPPAVEQEEELAADPTAIAGPEVGAEPEAGVETQTAEPAAAQPAAAETTPAAVEPPRAPPATAPLQVTLTFRERCYVEATVDGERRIRQEHSTGETVELTAQREVVLTLGNAGGVEVTVNGRPYDLGRGRGQVARVKIDLETAKSIAEAP